MTTGYIGHGGLMLDLTTVDLLSSACVSLQELHLTGCAVAAKDSFAVVVVEGGPKALKFYKKLMLKRMKWHITVEAEKARAEGEDEPAAAEDEEGEAPNPVCVSTYSQPPAALCRPQVLHCRVCSLMQLPAVHTLNRCQRLTIWQCVFGISSPGIHSRKHRSCAGCELCGVLLQAKRIRRVPSWCGRAM